MSNAKRKFEKGARIMSVWQFAALGSHRTLANLIQAGRLYEALPSGTTAKLKEARCLGNTARAVFTEEMET